MARIFQCLLATTILALASGPAGAQAIDKFVVTGDAAKKVMSKSEISAETAQKITDVCVDFAKQHNLAVSIFILSPQGYVVHAHRMDGQGPVNIETAEMKAKTALYMHDSTHVWANREIQNPGFFSFNAIQLNQYWVSGGLPIVVDDQLIGAIGVGGSNMDEECANAGLTAVLGPQPPLAPRLQPNGAPAAPLPPAR